MFTSCKGYRKIPIYYVFTKNCDGSLGEKLAAHKSKDLAHDFQMQKPITREIVEKEIVEILCDDGTEVFFEITGEQVSPKGDAIERERILEKLTSEERRVLGL